ncbi:nonribosomal peptide synthetase gloA [Physcia stellaris]|nr:nonribosomal peptide synthetase gloA [Physcia stellaris]
MPAHATQDLKGLHYNTGATRYRKLKKFKAGFEGNLIVDVARFYWDVTFLASDEPPNVRLFNVELASVTTHWGQWFAVTCAWDDITDFVELDSDNFIEFRCSGSLWIERYQLAIIAVLVMDLLGEVPQGVSKVPNGVSEVPNGVSEVPQGVSKVPNGVSEVPNGVSEVPLSASDGAANGSVSCGEYEEDFVTIPDLFVSFVSVKPLANPFYDKVKAESESWIAEVCNYSDTDRKKRIRADFPYFAALWTAEAAETEYRCISDWCNWTNEKSTNGFSKIQKSDLCGGYLILFGFVFSRYGNYNISVAMQLLTQDLASAHHWVEVRNLQTLPDEGSYLELRRESIGVYPCLALAEYFNGLELPDHVFQDRAIKTLRECAADIVLLTTFFPIIKNSFSGIKGFHSKKPMIGLTSFYENVTDGGI